MATINTNYKELSISQRIQLVEEIWDSIAEESVSLMSISTEEAEELNRRLAAHLADPASSIPWEQVRKGLFKKQN